MKEWKRLSESEVGWKCFEALKKKKQKISLTTPQKMSACENDDVFYAVGALIIIIHLFIYF